MAIPRIIHYCWLSDNPLTSFAAYCLGEWQKLLPDYEFIKWDKQRFDITQVPWVAEAYACGKYAFAADYVRLYALYNHGGLYLDLDVILRSDPSELLTDGFVSFVECYYNAQGQLSSGCSIQAAAMAAEPYHPFVKRAMQEYEDRHFTPDMVNDPYLIAPVVLQRVAEEYGFRQIDEVQHLTENITIYPSQLCSPNSRSATAAAVAIHYTDHSWQDKGFLSNTAKKIRRLMRTLRMRLLGQK